MSGSKTVSGFSIILILKGVITFQSFQECKSPQAPPPPTHTKSGKGYPQAKLLLKGGWQRPIVPTWAINSTFRTAKAASNGNRTKVSLKLTSRVNLGTRVTRAPSSPLWTQPTSPLQPEKGWSQRVHAFYWTKIWTLIKTKWNWKWKILHTVLERQTVCFISCKNRRLKVKLWWVGARGRKKIAFFCTVYSVRREFFKDLCFISMYSVLNTFSGYTYFYISKNIASYTFVLCFLFHLFICWNRGPKPS